MGVIAKKMAAPDSARHKAYFANVPAFHAKTGTIFRIGIVLKPATSRFMGSHFVKHTVADNDTLRFRGLFGITTSDAKRVAPPYDACLISDTTCSEAKREKVA